jgi:antibiotic biosynthesis monooxygenase (ABM) superfamily enzyme
MNTNTATTTGSRTTPLEAQAMSSAPLAAPPLPSVHVRALITWLAIFPLVAVGMALIAPLSEGWPPVLRAFALTLVVVPLAVYLVVPRLFKAYGMLRRRRTSR